MNRAQDLVDDIARDPRDPNIGRLANDLVSAISRGDGSVEDLRPMLSSLDPAMVEIGIWVASELGRAAAPLLDVIAPLLAHPAMTVRHDAIDCLLSSAGAARDRELAAALPLLGDAEAAIRFKAMDFLCRLSVPELQQVLAYLEASEPGSAHAHGLRWLLGPGSGDSPREVISAIDGPDPLLRRYGAAAAVRMAPNSHDPLLHASTVEDADVQQFAADALRMKAR